MSLQSDIFAACAGEEFSRLLGPGFNVVFTNSRRTIVSVDSRTRPATAKVSSIFTMADTMIIQELCRFIKGGAKSLPPAVKAFIHERPPIRIAGNLKGKRRKTKGKIYDLKGLMQKVDEEYFKGSLQASITWGRNPPQPDGKKKRKRSIRYGSYDHDLDLVTIHPALDDNRIPESFVRFVIYHEMLHKVVRPEVTSEGAVRFHNKLFRLKERQFFGYKEVRAWEKENIWKVLNSPTRSKTKSGAGS